MTLSIVASNPITKELCVATMTCLVAVGEIVPMVIPGVGSTAVQAKVKPSNRFKILELMKNNAVLINTARGPIVDEEALYEELVALGVEVLFDDRKERPGVMFNDMELIGIPHSIVIGERNLDNQQVEYKNRRTGEKQLLDISAAKDFVAAL